MVQQQQDTDNNDNNNDINPDYLQLKHCSVLGIWEIRQACISGVRLDRR